MIARRTLQMIHQYENIVVLRNSLRNHQGETAKNGKTE
jgi:hypothetical protein